MPTEHKEWLSPKEVHKEFGLSVSTLAKWRMNNTYLNYTKIGKYIKYKRGDVVEFLESHNVEVVA